MAGRKRLPEIERFMEYVKLLDNGCWFWLGYKMPNGYGHFQSSEGGRLAHRAAFRLLKGKLDGSMEVMHSCDNPSCVNPDHLSLGTRTENMQDAKRKGRNARGEGHGRSKLSCRDVEMIMKSPLSQAEIGQLFGISQGHVSEIKAGKKWSHLSEENCH